MPRRINYRPRLIDELITNERLKSYQNVFSTNNDIELVGVYLWNTNVSSALYPLLSTAEITLRNSVDNALSNDLGEFWWKKTKLHYKSYQSGQNNIPFTVKAIRDNFSKATEKVKKDKRNRYGVKNPVPNHNEIISNTELSTWEFIFDNEFCANDLIWPKNLGTVLNGVWPSSKAKKTLSHTKDLVKTVREYRNRVFHHEPAWKGYGVVNQEDAIRHILEKLNKIEQLIELISPEKLELLNKNELISKAYRAASESELKRCQHIIKTHNVKSILKLSQVIEQSLKNNTVEKIKLYKPCKINIFLHPN